ncbi:MAG: replicative DNA helicase [Pseudomonadota bacterium]
MTETLGYRLPPQDVEAEQCVLGSVLLEGSAIFEVVDVVNEEDFYREAHKKIFTAIKRLIEKTEPVDIITVQGELKKMNELEAVGDAAYLSELIAMVPTAAHASNYAKIVKEKSLERKLLNTCTTIISDIYNSGEDTETLLNDAEAKIFDVASGNIQNPYYDVKDLTKDYFKRIEELQQRGGALVGVGTGYKDIDNLTGGLKPGQLIIIAARPSMGKTALALNIAKNSALKFGTCVAVFSLEMKKEDVIGRLIGSEARIDISRLASGKVEDNEYVKLTDAASRLSETMIFIDDTSAITPGEIRAKCRRIKARYGKLDMVIVDYIQIMRGGSNNKTQNREQEISEISRTLKAISKELSVPIIALSQLNREADKRVHNKRPVLADLRESGAIEQDADMVIFIYRDEFYNPDTEWKGLAEIIIAKNRSGPTRNISLTWLSRYTSFENYVADDAYGMDYTDTL